MSLYGGGNGLGQCSLAVRAVTVAEFVSCSPEIFYPFLQQIIEGHLLNIQAVFENDY